MSDSYEQLKLWYRFAALIMPDRSLNYETVNCVSLQILVTQRQQRPFHDFPFVVNVHLVNNLRWLWRDMQIYFHSCTPPPPPYIHLYMGPRITIWDPYKWLVAPNLLRKYVTKIYFACPSEPRNDSSCRVHADQSGVTVILSRQCRHFCSEWCVAGYGTGALWMCEIDQFIKYMNITSFQWIKNIYI